MACKNVVAYWLVSEKVYFKPCP